LLRVSSPLDAVDWKIPMRRFARIGPYWPALLAGFAALLALLLLWMVRATPIQPLPLLRIDALSAFYAALLLVGGALLAFLQPTHWAFGWRDLAVLACLLLAWFTTPIPLLLLCYAVVALLSADRALGDEAARRWGVRLVWAARRELLSVGALLVGYGALALRGSFLYDARTAGAGLDSFNFWFVLLAAAIPAIDFWSRTSTSPLTNVARIAWLYPLARLYTLGPWNSGWSFATVLLGGALALWAAVAALARPTERAYLSQTSMLALALAGFGLSSSAGVAAGCYALLTFVILVLAQPDEDAEKDPQKGLLGWLLTGAVPFTAPFVAAWMLIGAAVAGGVALLGGVVWLALLLNCCAAALADLSGREPSLRIAAIASLVAGIFAPLVVRWGIQPVLEQLQGGLTPFGDINIWPWVGMAAISAGHTQITTLPTIAVAALMLVLSALVYVVTRLRDTWRDTDDSPDGPTAADVLTWLRAEVPWLRLVLPTEKQERPVDGE
jgi:hypothetical protein